MWAPRERNQKRHDRIFEEVFETKRKDADRVWFWAKSTEMRCKRGRTRGSDGEGQARRHLAKRQVSTARRPRITDPRPPQGEIITAGRPRRLTLKAQQPAISHGRKGLSQGFAGQFDELPGIPTPEIRVGRTGLSPVPERRFRISAEAAVAGVPQAFTFLALALFGQGAEGALISPCRLRLGHMLHIVFAVMGRVFVQPRPHFSKFLQSFCPFHDVVLPNAFGFRSASVFLQRSRRRLSLHLAWADENGHNVLLSIYHILAPLQVMNEN